MRGVEGDPCEKGSWTTDEWKVSAQKDGMRSDHGGRCTDQRDPFLNQNPSRSAGGKLPLLLRVVCSASISKLSCV